MRAVPMVVAFVVSLLLAPLAAAYKETDHLDSTLSTHQFILDHVPGILEADGHPELAAKLRAGWLDDLKWGSIEADRYLWRQANHYMSPDTHAGLATFESAGDLADRQFAIAQQDWVQSDADGALLHLGWAMEPMMDLTEPHHAHLDPIDSHEAYEEWVLAHQTELPAATAGVYDFPAGSAGHYANGSRAWDWVDYAAHASYDLFPLVDGPDGVQGRDYRAAASQMIPFAESLSVGFFYRMMERLDAAPPVAVAATRVLGADATVAVGAPLPFDGSGSTDDVAIRAYEWRLPGNVVVLGPTAEFTPAAPGRYPVTLTVTDSFGKMGQAATSVTAVLAPVAVMRGASQATVGAAIAFDGSLSRLNGTITAYVWSFGDGGTSTDAGAQHAYSSAGTYTVTLTISNSGERVTATASVHVTALPSASSPDGAVVVLIVLIAIVAIVLGRAALDSRRQSEEDRETKDEPR